MGVFVSHISRSRSPDSLLIRILYLLILLAQWTRTKSKMAHNENNKTKIIIIIIQKICSAHISTLMGAQSANPETPGQAPFSFTISVLGSIMVLLKDTSAATGHAGIRTHILTTPEL